jgi:phage repressor protein C with HTH and peptisase S24 domain
MISETEGGLEFRIPEVIPPYRHEVNARVSRVCVTMNTMNFKELVLTRRQRLKEARERAGYRSARAAAQENGWPESTYRSHETGLRAFGKEDAEKYATTYGVDIDWLWAISHPQLAESRPRIALPNATKLRDIIPFTDRRLRVLGQGGAEPSGRFLMTPDAVDMVPCPAVLQDVPDAYAVFVVGDSMDPRYRAGEIVYVHPGKPWRRGDFVVVQLNVGDKPEVYGYIKEFVSLTPSTLILRQLNPVEEIEFPRSQVRSIHKIIMSGEG